MLLSSAGAIDKILTPPDDKFSNSKVPKSEPSESSSALRVTWFADIMKSTQHFTEKRHSIGLIYEELRGVAGEFDIPVWTASQANRSSLEEDVIGADKVSEDYSKVMTADFVMSMSRKVEDKIANTGRFHVIKNRFGPDGLTFPATINTNRLYTNIWNQHTRGSFNTR